MTSLTAHKHPDTTQIIRKGAVRQRARVRWTSDVLDEMDYARSTMRAAMGFRDTSSDIGSIANVQKLSLLQEIYPTVATEILEEVLTTARFQVDVAASMLGELTRDPTEKVEKFDLVFVDMEDDDSQWHDVAASRPDLEQWVVVQDDWEVVDDDKVRTFADVLRSSSHAPESASTSKLPQLSILKTPISQSPMAVNKQDSLAAMFEDSEELCVKSFGARKRRNVRKWRG
ncbi:hypothetical protein Poli38472_003423 [Pythium oligandrum]|uniref:CUE domain-containing protein n=1 Tax=Pythium oligandrum TaxID=41045 RepID=A0A8K1C6U0_PYTOL|nr:hypothetical protein Poli38472_003423 [Pythium oligandrum]|eukprot:TMW57498.1 hypothetical protein Poli38472_003423 [Pythium oligandrum]